MRERRDKCARDLKRYMRAAAPAAIHARIGLPSCPAELRTRETEIRMHLFTI